MSPTGKVILRKLEQEIMKCTQGQSLPIHDHALSGEHTIECQEMRKAVKGVMRTMVVDKVAKTTWEEIRRMYKPPKETDLQFLTRVMFSYQTVERRSDERECVAMFFGKLAAPVQH